MDKPLLGARRRLFQFAKSILRQETAVTEAISEPEDDLIEAPQPLPATIEVRTLRWSFYKEGTPGGFNPTAQTWPIRDGYDVTVEPRSPEDGDAAYRIVTTPAPTHVDTIKPEVVTFETFQEMVARGYGNGTGGLDDSKIDPRVKGIKTNTGPTPDAYGRRYPLSRTRHSPINR